MDANELAHEMERVDADVIKTRDRMAVLNARAESTGISRTERRELQRLLSHSKSLEKRVAALLSKAEAILREGGVTSPF